ncbi:hypothetical protein BC829DRAFT_405445 [Chytridium lagenaria]|nr:hypothetical protein BC829DRAFT_405445 [Chytridium lagenaria]
MCVCVCVSVTRLFFLWLCAVYFVCVLFYFPIFVFFVCAGTFPGCFVDFFFYVAFICCMRMKMGLSVEVVYSIFFW